MISKEFYIINHPYFHSEKHQHSPYQGYDIMGVECVQTLQSCAVCTDPRCTITGAFSLPMSPPASLFPPLSSNLSYTTPRAFQFFYPFKTQSSFAALKLCCTFSLHLSQQCCPLSCRKGFDFSPSHCSIDSIFWSLFSWCFCGTFSWVYEIRMAICWNHWSKFCLCNYPIACAITQAMCTGKQFNFSWTSVGTFLHSNFENISSQMKLIFVDKALHHFSTNTISTCQSVPHPKVILHPLSYHSTSPAFNATFEKQIPKRGKGKSEREIHK